MIMDKSKTPSKKQLTNLFEHYQMNQQLELRALLPKSKMDKHNQNIFERLYPYKMITLYTVMCPVMVMQIKEMI